MNKSDKALKVFYGWSRINAVRKKISLSVVFENTLEARSKRGETTLSRIQETCYVRYQDEGEMESGRHASRIFTSFDLMLEDKPINGSLQRILQINSDADQYHVSAKEREKISEALKKAFLMKYPDYVEPENTAVR